MCWFARLSVIGKADPKSENVRLCLLLPLMVCFSLDPSQPTSLPDSRHNYARIFIHSMRSSTAATAAHASESAAAPLMICFYARPRHTSGGALATAPLHQPGGPDSRHINPHIHTHPAILSISPTMQDHTRRAGGEKMMRGGRCAMRQLHGDSPCCIAGLAL